MNATASTERTLLAIMPEVLQISGWEYPNDDRRREAITPWIDHNFWTLAGMFQDASAKVGDEPLGLILMINPNGPAESQVRVNYAGIERLIEAFGDLVETDLRAKTAANREEGQIPVFLLWAGSTPEGRNPSFNQFSIDTITKRFCDLMDEVDPENQTTP